VSVFGANVMSTSSPARIGEDFASVISMFAFPLKLESVGLISVIVPLQVFEFPVIFVVSLSAISESSSWFTLVEIVRSWRFSIVKRTCPGPVWFPSFAWIAVTTPEIGALMFCASTCSFEISLPDFA